VSHQRLACPFQISELKAFDLGQAIDIIKRIGSQELSNLLDVPDVFIGKMYCYAY
jgi:hypothetical protein